MFICTLPEEIEEMIENSISEIGETAFYVENLVDRLSDSLLRPMCPAPDQAH
ncbi:MAG TPA: hypothetical protein PKA63_06190 [Oligoflexia bacterium]|nr:hypothetical protein [Oligoflexia bacterium]HMP48239.1 hypothetical protein [Oligoflexia bacterium]